MVGPTRRQLLCTASTFGMGTLAGCGQALLESDGDVVIGNWDDATHEFAVTMDDGGDTKEGTVTVEADSRGELTDFLPQSDWPYPFLLHITVDGEYVATTKHRWQNRIEVVYLTDGSVIADETEIDIEVTPSEGYPTPSPDTTTKTP
ncbi:hypothetical protein KTS45_14945 [Halomicroarcula limicola]|uniref:Uncharacterized protein n=1 Tax=Haloarcula limicola TaxID=1429915 RepID=A0A8J7YBC3_9EURY|nr:hypothetical protein [Halomicroarcula limicola]MBV0925501.1 hypothetical protein [Halomicroarcula limicola]